jgi:hypothetical protein
MKLKCHRNIHPPPRGAVHPHRAHPKSGTSHPFDEEEYVEALTIEIEVLIWKLKNLLWQFWRLFSFLSLHVSFLSLHGHAETRGSPAV